MKVNGFQVEEHGSGYAVTLRLHVGREEVALAKVSIDFSRFMAEFHRGIELGSEEDKKPAADPPSTAQPAGRRTRRTRAAQPAAPTQTAEEAKSDANPTEPASTAGRRSRRKTPQAAVAGTAKSPSKDPTGATRRRARSSAKAAGGSGAGGGRRASKKTASSASSPSEEVSDADLTKTASLAAADIGVDAVMSILEKFEVKEVRALSQEQRQEFVAKLKKARAKATDD